MQENADYWGNSDRITRFVLEVYGDIDKTEELIVLDTYTCVKKCNTILRKIRAFRESAFLKDILQRPLILKDLDSLADETDRLSRKAYRKMEGFRGIYDFEGIERKFRLAERIVETTPEDARGLLNYLAIILGKVETGARMSGRYDKLKSYKERMKSLVERAHSEVVLF